MRNLLGSYCCMTMSKFDIIWDLGWGIPSQNAIYGRIVIGPGNKCSLFILPLSVRKETQLACFQLQEDFSGMVLGIY